MTRAVLTPRAVWWRARAPVGLSKLCQLLALSAWHGIAQERSAGSSGKQISALRIEISDQNFLAAMAQRSDLREAGGGCGWRMVRCQRPAGVLWPPGGPAC